LAQYHARRAVEHGVEQQAGRGDADQEQANAVETAARAEVRRRVAHRERGDERGRHLDPLGRAVGLATRQLAPAQLAQLRGVVTAPQIALASRLTAAVKDPVRGGEEERER
jgi:hypothetical protein